MQLVRSELLEVLVSPCAPFYKAAIIMISVFASFIFSPDPTTKSLGFGLALGVLIDAFIVRMTIIPATMYLYGRAAWWLPRFLGKALPEIDIEGQKLATPTE